MYSICNVILKFTITNLFQATIHLPHISELNMAAFAHLLHLSLILLWIDRHGYCS